MNIGDEYHQSNVCLARLYRVEIPIDASNLIVSASNYHSLIIELPFIHFIYSKYSFLCSIYFYLSTKTIFHLSD